MRTVICVLMTLFFLAASCATVLQQLQRLQNVEVPAKVQGDPRGVWAEKSGESRLAPLSQRKRGGGDVTALTYSRENV